MVKIMDHLGETARAYGQQNNRQKCTDHKGRTFPSIRKMCEYWGVCNTTFKRRINQGMSVEEALTMPSCTATLSRDHTGGKFSSIRKMCTHWGINHRTFLGRLEMGMNIEEALTIPLSHKHEAQSCEDHLGNKFKSSYAMCKHYGVNYQQYMTRIRRLGWSVEQALTTPKKERY